MTASFQVPIPEELLKDPATAEYFRALQLFINDLVAPEGVIATGEATQEVVLTQQEKLDLMTISQPVNLDTVESQAQAATDALDALLNSLPTYSITNDGTVRTLNADAGDITISNPVTQTEGEAIVDAFNKLSDYVATLTRDLVNKDVLGT